MLGSTEMKDTGPVDQLDASGVRVLVVDDSRAQRHILAMYLRKWGYEVLESASADAALALCASIRVGVVISDWMMPGMSGVEIRKVRNRQRVGSGGR